MKFSDQKGIIHTLPLLLVIAVIGVLSFLLITSTAPLGGMLGDLNPKPQSYAATQITGTGTKIPWQGSNWFIAGANVPWYNWAQDFGGGTSGGGVAGNTAVLSAGFQQLKNSGVHMVRWWVFPGDPWQINRDGNGPTTLNTAVYQDFDAAVALANQYDLYFDFVLFNSATAMPSTWLTNTTQRGKLVTALTPLFARYSGNPRVMSWEIYNEPEFQIWNNEIAQAPVVDTATALTTAIHTNAPGTLVTVGNASADGIPMWKGTGLDFYSPHWYDYMNSGVFCMRCNDYNFYIQNLGADRPLVIGEFFGDSQAKWTDFYNKGYAGGWAWSLFPGRTSDNLAINMPAMTSFVAAHNDIGPRSTVATPTPTGTPGPTVRPSATPITTPVPTPNSAAYTISATVAPNPVSRGSSFVVTTQVRPQFAQTSIVDVEVYDSAGAKAFQMAYENESFTANQTKTYTTTFTTTSGNPIGSYRVQIGIFAPNWTAELRWNDFGPDGTFSVTAATPVPTPTRTPSPTPISTPQTCPKGPIGDANCDGAIDIFDYSLIITHFGQSGTNILGDVNKDGIVDIFDYSLIVTHFGQ